MRLCSLFGADENPLTFDKLPRPIFLATYRHSLANGGPNMRSIARLIKRLKSDESGAALIEYTVLLGIMLVAVIGLIVAVGGWVSTQWSTLNATI